MENKKQAKLGLDIAIIAGLMIVFGLAEVITSFTHQFFGLTTSQQAFSTLIGAAIGISYFASGLLVLTRRKWAASLAIVLLIADALGRIAMVLTNLYPIDSARQTFAIIMGTAIVIFFAIYIWLKRKSFI